MKRIALRAAAACVLPAVLALASAPAANAAITKTAVIGTVNCTGTITTYQTVRFMDGFNNIQIYLTAAA